MAMIAHLPRVSTRSISPRSVQRLPELSLSSLVLRSSQAFEETPQSWDSGVCLSFRLSQLSPKRLRQDRLLQAVEFCF
jgi:hypothetical protein